MRRKLLLAAALVAAPLLGMSSAWAVPITPSPTITTGNVTFNNFTCSVVSGSGLTCGQINVTSHVSTMPPDPTSGDNGIRIQGAFSAFPLTEDVAITYDAHVTGSLFHDASMAFNGTMVSSVDEKIYIAGTSTLIGHLDVINNGGTPVLTDDIVLSQDVANVSIVKDVNLTTVGGQSGTISLIDQNFSETTRVPEPASLTLLGTALLGLGLFGRRRKKS